MYNAKNQIYHQATKVGLSLLCFNIYQKF